MRHLILFQLILFKVTIFITIDCQSQEYIPMNFSKGFWIEEYFEKGGYEEKIQKFCNGDTLIDYQLYYKLCEIKIVYDPGFNPDTLIDTNLGFIGNFNDKTIKYIRKGEENPITIYDFNLTIGDTIQGILDQFIINAIDSIEICGHYHKRYIQDIGTGNPQETLIEGVGYYNGLLGYFDIFYEFAETYKSLECYSEWNNQECSTCNYIASIPTQNLNFKIYPNPVLDKLTVQSSRQIILIQVYDVIGNIWLIKNPVNEVCETLELSHLLPGIYILRVQLNDDLFRTFTIIKN